jgi:hypothetical protein
MNSVAFNMLEATPGPGSYAIRDAMKRYIQGKGIKISVKLKVP